MKTNDMATITSEASPGLIDSCTSQQDITNQIHGALLWLHFVFKQGNCCF